MTESTPSNVDRQAVALAPPMVNTPIAPRNSISIVMGDQVLLGLRASRAGGLEYFLAKRSVFGGFSERSARTFQLTQEGWTEAWLVFSATCPAAARAYLNKIDRGDSDAAAVATRRAQFATRATLGSIGNLALVAGFALEPLVVGRNYSLYFTDEAILVADAAAREVDSLAHADLLALNVDGPGAVTKGGGFIGGGIGLGAVEGMAIAGVLNALTTRTSVTTFVEIQDSSKHLLFVHSAMTPDEISLRLKTVHARMRAQAQTASRNQQSSHAQLDPIERLRRLGELHQQGILTDDEFRAAKEGLLANLE